MGEVLLTHAEEKKQREHLLTKVDSTGTYYTQRSLPTADTYKI